MSRYSDEINSVILKELALMADLSPTHLATKEYSECCAYRPHQAHVGTYEECLRKAANWIDEDRDELSAELEMNGSADCGDFSIFVRKIDPDVFATHPEEE